MKKFPLVVLALACLIFLITSCSINNNDTTNPQTGYFLVANVSPDAPPLTMVINGTQFATNFAFGYYIPYSGVTAGAYTFSFYDSASNTVPVLSSTLNVSALTNYSYFLVDSFSRIKASYVQDVIPAPSADSAYIRFFDFSPNAGVVALKDSAAGKDVYANRAFNDQSFTASYATFSRLLKGTYTFQLKLSDSSIAVSKADTLAGGHVYTIYARGNIGGSNAQAISIGQILNY